MAEVDLEALKRYAAYLKGERTLGEETATGLDVLRQLPAIIAALERIPELERSRDKLWAEAMQMEERAERVEAAVASVECRITEQVDHVDPDGVIRIYAATVRGWRWELRAVLAAAPGEEGRNA